MEAIFINDYLRDEIKNMSWQDKLVRNYPKIARTSELALPFDKIEQPQEILVRPSVFNTITLLLIAFFTIVLCLALVKMLQEHPQFFLIPLSGLILVCFVIYAAMRYLFFNPEIIHSIRLNKDFIQFGEQTFDWTSIAETCILTRMKGRYRNGYLVIFKNDFSVQKFNLYQFRISLQELATYIEYYKTSNSKQAHV